MSYAKMELSEYVDVSDEKLLVGGLWHDVSWRTEATIIEDHLVIDQKPSTVSLDRNHVS